VSTYSRELTEVKAQHERTKRLLEELQQGQKVDRYLADIADEEAKTADRVRADEAFAAWSRNAPAPKTAETRNEYRARLCHRAAHYLPVDHELRDVRLDGMSSKATEIFFNEFMRELSKAARDADTVPRGTLRKIEERSPSGHTRTSFVGPRPFTDFLGAANRRVCGWGAEADTSSPYAGVLARANRLLAG
jgi:hypothetical protein